MKDRIRELSVYGVCGAMAAAINVAVFMLLADVVHIYYLLATIIAWCCSTAFAFCTNKFFVFRSRSLDRRTVLRESRNFLGSRCISGLMDVAGMYILADICGIHHDMAKIAVMLLIVINNYVLSKFWVFNKKI